MRKPYFNNTEIKTGDILDSNIHQVEDGVVVGINYELEELHLYGDGMGWTVSTNNDNLGLIKWA